MIGDTYQRILDLLTNTPGNFVYHVVVALIIFGALQAALNLWQDNVLRRSRRVVLGLSFLLGIRLLLFYLAILINLDLLNAYFLIPSADRVVMVLSVVIIIWLWVFPETSHLADASTGFLAFLAMTVFFLTQFWWEHLIQGVAFNSTLLYLVWEVSALFLLSIGLILVLIRKRNGWGYGLAMISILFFGHLVQLFYPDNNSDFPGAVRLFELAAFPLLWSIPNHVAVNICKGNGSIEKDDSLGVSSHSRGESTAFHSILSLADKSSPTTIHQKIAKLLAESFHADFSFVFHPPDSQGQVIIPSGFDSIRGAFRSTLSIDGEKIPMLVTAMNRLRPLRLSATSNSPETRIIAKTFNLAQTGHILAAFVPSFVGNSHTMGIVLLSIQSKRQWSRDDQALLNKIAASLSPILYPKEQVKTMLTELDNSKQKLSEVEALLTETKAQKDTLRNEINKFSGNISHVRTNEVDDLLNQVMELRMTINHLDLGKSEAEGDHILKDLNISDRRQLRQEMKLAINEITNLNDFLSGSEEETEG